MKTIPCFVTLISFLFSLSVMVTNAEARDLSDQKRSTEMQTALVNAPGTSNMTHPPSGGSPFRPGSSLLPGNPGQGLNAGGIPGKKAKPDFIYKQSEGRPQPVKYIDDAEKDGLKPGFQFYLPGGEPQDPNKNYQWYPEIETRKERPTKKKPD